MIKVKDGYAKLIGTTYAGSASRVLLSNGGDHVLGNASGNIPLNNGTVNTNLNSDLLDGLHAGTSNGTVATYTIFPSYTTLINEGFLESDYVAKGHPDELFLKALCKWAINKYSASDPITGSDKATLIGYIGPNSSGTCIIHLYRYQKDSTTLLPRYCRGLYQTLGGTLFQFGTSNYVWSYWRYAHASEIPNVTNYYWANIPVSSASNTNTTPTFSKWTTSDLNLVQYTTGGKDIGMRVTGKTNSIGFIIGSSNTSRGIYDYTNSNWILVKDASNNIILPSGNVGISTSSPSQKLHVNGDIFLNNYLYFTDSAVARIKYGTHTATALGSYPLPSLGSQGLGLYVRPHKDTDEGGIIITEDTCMIFNAGDVGWNFQVHNTDLKQTDFSGTEGKGELSRTFGVTEPYHYAWSRGGFQKNGSDDTYVLLGGGGHKAIGNASGNIPLNNGTVCTNLNADLLDGYHESDFFRYRGPLHQNNSHDANSLAIGEYAFRDSAYGNVGSGNAHKNVLANNSTIQVFKWLQLSSAAWSNTVAYRVNWTGETNSSRPNGWSSWINFLSSSNSSVSGGGSSGGSSLSVKINDNTATLTIPTSLPASDVHSWAKEENKPSYSFSEISPGIATIGDGANRIMWRTNSSYVSGLYYSTPGNESVVFANKNAVTSWIFATTDPTSRSDWKTLTPSLQIKNGRVAINKLIADGTTADYHLDVNGGAKFSYALAYSIISNEITFYTRGNGTYDRAWLTAKDSSGQFCLEAPLQTDSSSGTRSPIVLTWRGGYPSKGGLKITGHSEAYLGGNTIIHSGNYNSHLPVKLINDPGKTTLINSYGLNANYGSSSYGHPTEEYLKAFSKYLLAKAAGYTCVGYIGPSSRGSYICDVYNNGTNSTTNLPEHITGHYFPHGGTHYHFGTSYGVWYYYTALHSGNYTTYTVTKTGSGASGTWNINISGNAATVNGLSVTTGNNKPWGTIPSITKSGYMDVGKHFEFHYDNTTGSDYSTALTCTGNHGNVVNLPSASGTLALTSQIPTVTNYYWADISIQSTSDATKVPTFGGIKTNGNILLGAEGILGFGSSIPSKYLNSAAISPDASAVWLATTGNVKDVASQEASGIVFDGNTIKMWSPIDSAVQLIDSDSGTAYNFYHSGNLTKLSQLSNDVGYITGSYLPLAGGQMNAGAFISWNNGAEGNDVSDWNFTTNGLKIISSVSTNTNSPTRYATALHVKGRYGFQLASEGGSTSNNFYIKNVHNTIWNILIHSNNYTSYTVKKDGTGATGTWAINISGNAANSSQLGGIDASKYRRLDITQMYGDEKSSQFYISRCKDGGGGWAYAPIEVFKGDKTTLISNIGVYGQGNALTYSYFGSHDYDGTNLRVYSNGSVRAATFKKYDGTEVSYSGHTHSYLPLSGGWMNWNAQINFKGLNDSTSVFGRIGYAKTASSQTMHCLSNGGYQADGALYITSNGSTSNNDTGGLAIDNEGVTVFGAGDAGSNFTGIFRVLNEDNVADGPQFIVTKASGATVKYNMYAAHFYESSDKQLKTNIQEILNSDKMPIIKEFDWKEDNSHSYGLIAQELEEQGYSELVSVKDDGYKTVNYSAALSLIVGKLQVKIKELEKEIEILKNKN